MAIQEFSSGPQNYFEPGYFDGDYTEPNVSRALLQCDIDAVKGGVFVTGEYYLGNYIDGSYYHDNSIRSTLVCTPSELSSGVFVTGQFYLGNYIDGTYYHDNSIKSTFTATASKIFSVNAALQDYFEPGYFVNGYIEGRSAKATVSCQVTRARSATATFVSEFQQTTQARLISDINLFAFGDAAIGVQVSRIRGNNIAASTVFNVATDFVVKRNGDADVDAIFSAIIAGLRSRDVNLQTQAAFSFVSSAGVTRPVASVLVCQSSVNASATVNRSAVITTTSTATASISGDRIRFTAVTVNLEFTVDATARKIRDAHLTGTGVAAINCIANFTANGSASIQSNGTVFFNGGKRSLASSALTAFSGIVVSRYVGSDRPKTLTGTFSNGYLINSANRVSDLRALNSDNWYYETLVMATASPAFDNLDAEILNIPLGNKGNFAFQLRWRSAQNLTIGGQGLGTSFALVAPGGQFALAISFTGGQKVAVYVNGVRVALNTNFNSAGWVIPKTQTVAFASGFPTTINTNPPRIWTSTTDYAWLTLGNYTNSGAATYTSPTVANTEDTLFLYQFNNGNEDLGATLTGAAAIQSQATVSAAVGYIVIGQAAISASSSVVALGGKTKEINLVAFDDAELSATATRIKSLSGALVSQSTVTALAVVNRSANVTVAADVTVSTVAERKASAGADFTAFVSQLTASIRLRGLLAVDISEFQMSVSANKTGSAVIAVSVSSNVQSTATRIKSLASDITSAVSVSANAVKTTATQSTIQSVVSQSTTVSANRNAVIVTQAISSQLSAVVRLAGLFADDLCEFNVTTVGRRTASAQGGLETITSQLTVTAFNIKQLSSVLQSSVTVTTNAVVAKIFAGSFSSNFAQTAAGNRIRFSAMSAAAVSQVTATGINLGKIECTLFDAVTLTATVKKMVGVGATPPPAIATVNVTANRQRNAESAVTSNSSVSVSGQTVIVASAVFATVASQLSVVVEIAGLQAAMSTVATMTVQGTRNRRATAAIQANSQVTAQGGYRTNFNAALTANSSMSANGGYTVNAVANIASALTFVVTVREIRLDNIVYVIPGETRVYVIRSETRIHKIRQ